MPDTELNATASTGISSDAYGELTAAMADFFELGGAMLWTLSHLGLYLPASGAASAGRACQSVESASIGGINWGDDSRYRQRANRCEDLTLRLCCKDSNKVRAERATATPCQQQRTLLANTVAISIQATAFLDPSTASLALAMLMAQLTPGIGREEIAGIEPMHRAGARQNGRNCTGELGVVRTPIVPQREPIRHVSETKELLHAAIAIGGNDQNATWQLRRGAPKPEHDIVMELALRPVIEMVDRAKGTV